MCHRQGASAAAEVLARSLERIRRRALCDGVVGAGEFETVLAALRDPSFTFVDALSVGVRGRRPLVAGADRGRRPDLVASSGSGRREMSSRPGTACTGFGRALATSGAR